LKTALKIVGLLTYYIDVGHRTVITTSPKLLERLQQLQLKGRTSTSRRKKVVREVYSDDDEIDNEEKALPPGPEEAINSTSDRLPELVFGGFRLLSL